MSKQLTEHHISGGTTDLHNSDADALRTLVFYNSEDIFLLVDKDLNLLLYNDVAHRSFQQYFHRAIRKGDPILEFADPRRVGDLKKIYARVLEGNSVETDVQLTWEGSAKTFENRFRPARDKSGAVVAVLVWVYDVTEKRATETALRKSEERLRFALEGSDHGIWDWIIKTGEIQFSPSWKKMLGFEESEIQNNIDEWQKRIHPEDKEQLSRDLHTHFNSDTPTYENSYRLLAKDGTYKWIEGRGKIVERTLDGTPLRMIGTHVDITKKKESEEQYRNLFNIIPLPTWIYDYETLRFLAVNCAAANHYGYSKEEFLQMSIKDIRPPGEQEMLSSVLPGRGKQLQTTYSNWKHKKSNGAVIIVEINATTISYNGRKARLVVINDVTEKAAADEELHRSNKRFQYVTKATSDAIYELEFETGHLAWGEGLTTIFGHAPHEITMPDWEAHIHPDDRETTLQSLYATVYNSRKKLWKMEYRFLKTDGAYRYVIDKGFILRDGANKPLRMIGAIQDITNLKEKQLELLESNKRYEYATLAVSDIIWDWVLERDCVLWSDNYEKLTGWKLPEDKCLAVDLCIERFHESDRERVTESMLDAINDASRTTWDAELKYVKASGHIAYIYNRGYILRDERGKAVRMIGAMQDITDRKRLEEQLLQKERDRQKQISKATIDTQERERSEIGRELHDNVNQVLTTTKLYLELALSNAELKDDLLQKSQTNIMYVINEIRQLSRSLMNPSLGDLGLVASINDLVENIQATRKLNVQFEAEEALEAALPESLGLTIYRIIQEALNNAVKHAQATTVSVFIRKLEPGIELTIQDNGIGFDPEQIKRGAGLKNIENRVYLANGTLYIRSTPGNGCTLLIRFTL